jgi:hypothetical protein
MFLLQSGEPILSQMNKVVICEITYVKPVTKGIYRIGLNKKKLQPPRQFKILITNALQ